MPLIHRLLYGEGAALYLPFAESRLRALSALDPEGTFSQTFIVDNATINVRQVGEFHYIMIFMAGGFYFEFATSGFPVLTAGLTVEGVGNVNIYTGMVIGVNVATKRGVLTATPFVCNNKRDPFASLNGFFQQAQLLSEPVHYPEQNAKLRKNYVLQKAIYEAYAAEHSHTGFPFRNTLLNYERFTFLLQPGSSVSSYARDVQYDYEWALGVKLTAQKYASIDIGADWPRGSGYCLVTDEKWGSRAFGLRVDTFGIVSIFPVDAIEFRTDDNRTQTVPEKYVKQVEPTLPAWVVAPSIKARDYWLTNPNVLEWMIDQPDYDWKFNLSGTKMCAVMYGRSEFNNDTAYWAADADPDTPWEADDFGRLRDRLSSFTVFGSNAPDITHTPQRYFYGPGLVECEFTITLRGDKLEEFDVAIETTEIRNPNTADHCALYAGYAWVDATISDTEVDDMIVLDVEGWSRPSTTDGTHHALLVMKNLAKGTEVQSTFAHPILAVDLATLSLVMKLRVTDYHVSVSTPRISGSASEAMDWVVEKFGVWVTRAGQTKEILFPDIMPNEWKEELQAAATFDARTELAALVAGDATWGLVTLANSRDGWSDASINSYRRYWAGSQLYWYNEPWVLDDPDWDFHGTSYPDQGWVRYKTNVATPGDATATEGLINNAWSPSEFACTNWHLMFCDNPRWGWHYYQAVIQHYVANIGETTFYMHPNGTWALWCNHLIFNQQGILNNGNSSTTIDASFHANSLAIIDATKMEHCVFDRIHFETRTSKGKVATLDTTFLAQYNKAIQRGRDNKTLEDEDLATMVKSDMQGTFEAQTVVYPYSAETDVFTLQWKFEFNGREFYFVEQTIRGYFTVDEPTVIFKPMTGGNSLGLSLDMQWYMSPYVSGATIFQSAPIAIDPLDQAAYTIRFCNPQVLMG